MSTKREAFLAAARSQINNGIYVWGGNGENLLTMSDPEAWIRKKETSKENAERAINLFHEREENGIAPIQAFDCSGLVYWAQKEAKIGYGDKTANGYWRECDPVETLQAGDLVFHHNGIKCVHVGIYNGDGYVIESYGRDKGVILSKRSDKNYWNRAGRLKRMKDDYLLGDVNLDGKVTAADAALILRYLDGLDILSDEQLRNADVNRDGEVTQDDADAILNYVTGKGTIPPASKVRVIGGSVRVREGDNAGSKCVGIAHRGDEFPLLGVAKSGWYMIEYRGTSAYITNKAKYTILV